MIRFKFVLSRAARLLAGMTALALLSTTAGADHQPFQLVDAPQGHGLSAEEIQSLAARFTQMPLRGGQVAPRLYAAVNDDVSIFLQFDNADPAQATTLRYIGISVRGVFCAEAQPDPAFTHFHSFRPAAMYSQGHGGEPGEEGYWLLWVATDSFTTGGRQVVPGVDREFSPTPPVAC